MAAKWLSTVFAVTCLAGAGAVFAQDEEGTRQQPSVGLKLGASFFSNGEMRQALGDAQLGIGISFATRSLRDKWDLMGDVDALWAHRNGNRLFLLPLTVGVGRTFGDVDTSETVPFAAIRAGLAYTDYSITGDSGVRQSDNKFLPTANIEAGLMFGRNVSLSARYDWFGKSDSLDFNNLKIVAAYRFVKF